MKSSLCKLAMVVAVCSAFAIAQATFPNASTQQMPSASGQTSPGQYPPSSTQPGPGQSSTPSSTGSDVQSRIQSALQQDPSLAGANITVSASADKVELSGTVASKDEKEKARSIAESYAGGLKVVDHIKVSSKGTTSTNPSKY